jgi:general secretion pathway protein G
MVDAKNMRTALRASRSGFSLIEIMIAVSIIALVAGLVVPNAMDYFRKARIKSTRVAMKGVQDAIQSFNMDTGSYPASLSDLKVRPSDERTAKRWDGPYLSGDPNDAWGNELVYTLRPKGSQPPYELYSWGASGEGSPQEEWIHARED